MLRTTSTELTPRRLLDRSLAPLWIRAPKTSRAQHPTECVDAGPSALNVQIPVGLNILIPVIVYACIWFIPESPRWLVSKHRDEKAVAALIQINKSDPNYTPTEDIDDIRADHEASLAEGSGSWGELFTNPVEFRKLVAVFGILAGQQITGVQFIFSCAFTSSPAHSRRADATVIATSLQLANPFIITIVRSTGLAVTNLTLRSSTSSKCWACYSASW